MSLPAFTCKNYSTYIKKLLSEFCKPGPILGSSVLESISKLPRTPSLKTVLETRNKELLSTAAMSLSDIIT
uniref:Uncharacterized protein n=1 Tax=Romanomermis culicivorax TaxID=13658 RepID=A0A915K188_ROMCU